mgnify:CR=1 FL=1
MKNYTKPYEHLIEKNSLRLASGIVRFKKSFVRSFMKDNVFDNLLNRMVIANPCLIKNSRDETPK